MIHYDIEKHEDITIVYLAGDFTLQSIDRVDELMQEIIKDTPRVIAFDMIELDHIDSYGINHLFNYTRKIDREETALYIYNANETIMEILTVTNLCTMYTITTKKEFIKDFLLGIEDEEEVSAGPE